MKVKPGYKSTVLEVPEGRNDTRKALRLSHFQCWDRGLTEHELDDARRQRRRTTMAKAKTAGLILVAFFAAMFGACSTATVTITTIPNGNTIYNYTRVYEDGALIDMIPNNTTKDIEVTDGAQLIAAFESVQPGSTTLISTMGDTVIAKDGLIWDLKDVY